MSVAVLGVVTTVLTYGVILVLGLLGWFYWTHRAIIREADKLPTMLPRWPLIGNAYYVLGSLSDFTNNVIWYWEEAARRGIYTYCYWAGPLPLIIVSGAEDIKKLLGTSLHQGYEIENFCKEFLGYGLLTAPAEHWKITRRHMNPVFHPNNCRINVPLFNQNCRELVSRMSKHVGKDPVDVVDYLKETALKSVCYLIFGQSVEIDVDSQELQDFIRTGDTIPGIIIERIVKFWLRNDTIFNFIKGNEIKEKHAVIKRFFNKPLKKAQEIYEQKKRANQMETNTTLSGYNNDENNQKNVIAEPATVVDVYAALRESNPSITELNFYHELITTCLTGIETVASGVSFVLLLLAQYQDVQEKLYKEISSVVGDDDDVSIEDLNRMPYLEQVIKETLRFIQIVPFVTREIKEDMKLTSVTVPAGSTVYISLGGLHMDPNVFPEPEKFDPDRFAKNSTAKIDDETFIPFSRGPRGCIGKMYAQLVMRIMIVHILRRYHITTKMDYRTTKKSFVVSMSSDEGVYLSLNYRS